MWDVFDEIILDTEDDIDDMSPGRRWTRIYVAENGLQPPTIPPYQCQADDWYDLKRVDVFHGVYVCDDVFPWSALTLGPLWQCYARPE
jgi:hypothetical protein